MKLRPYQNRTLKDLYAWLSYYSGNPVINLPTGSGKSLIIAKLCEDIIKKYPGRKVLMLTGQKELIEQNAEKLRTIWPNAPIGIYSASVGQRNIDAITYAGIQTVRSRAQEIGHVDIILVDECHQINHNDEGTYRKLINDLTEINPKLRVIGLTASPYRMGHGLITDKPAIFDEILEPTSIEELQQKGFLAKLVSKSPKTHISVEGVGKRGGEYIESQLQKAVDVTEQNRRIVAEIMTRAGDRKSWLLFCAGVEHAEHIRDELRQLGIVAETIHNGVPKAERERILSEFKAGTIQAVTNNNVLTTGFDAPNIDLIALLRPTCSPGLYVQMAGRGLRLKEHTDHCLVLDFAGVIETHGPITQVQAPNKVKKGDGVAPCKNCPECDEIVAAQAKICPQCDYVFPKQEKRLHLRNDDIMGEDKLKEFDVQFWTWEVTTSKKSGKDMVKVNYHSGPFDKISEYLCIWHDGFAGVKGKRRLKELAEKSGAKELDTDDLNEATPPAKVVYYMDGKYPRIKDCIWS